ncbi:MAG TPA: sortase [Pseudolysinimonas sp.]|nr:sortase [Pseudolysinimonas sp.]
MLVSALLLGLVAHVSVVGNLQHSRSQVLLYQELRTELALATTPLGQLDVNGDLVPNGTPIAHLAIKKLGIDEVVVQGTRSEDLIAAPGHRRDTVFPGQEGTSVIMGRQATFGGPFGGLGAIVPGDTIEVVTGQGTSKYEVIGIRHDGELLPERLSKGEGRLELITADGTALAPSGALHVYASLKGHAHEKPAPVFTSAVLDPSEDAMAADSTGWFPTLFWLQWLIAAAIALRWVRGRWGVWQTWMIAIPILLGLGAFTANAAMTNLPNLL